MSPVNQTTLTNELLQAAGAFMAAMLNTLDAKARESIQAAHDAGRWCEVRVGLCEDAATVRLMLCGTDGHADQVGIVDFPTH